MTKTGSGDGRRSPGKQPEALAKGDTAAAALGPARGGAGRKPASEEAPKPAKEHGGPKGLEPTCYGDWQRKGIASDF